MRLLSLIFASFILTLSLAPVVNVADLLTDAEECTVSCCSSEMPTSSNNAADKGCDGICNPFICSSACCGYTMPFTNFDAVEVFIPQEKKHAFADQMESLPYIHAIWHPPQTA